MVADNLTVEKQQTFASTIAHLNPVAVVICDMDGIICSWHEGIQSQFGYSSADFVGRPITELFSDAEVFSFHSKNGEPVIVSAVTIPLNPLFGEINGFAKVLRRITSSSEMAHYPRLLNDATHADMSAQLQMRLELVSANARLKSMATELERSNQELEEFARIASHDLSAPITTTRWLVDLLTSRHGQQLNDEGQKCLGQIALSLARMADLVDAVLQHAKVGTSPIGSTEEADTELALEAALENLRRDIETSGARISYQKLPPLLIGQQPLTQLFQNLLSNAIKYRTPGALACISISAEQSEGLWRLAVTDNGIGVEPQWRERIFQPMQRLHGAEIAGSGIGLATCRKIVDRAGGRIWIEPNAGVGSTFYFVLPSLSTSDDSLQTATEKST